MTIIPREGATGPPAYCAPLGGERYPIDVPRWRSDAGEPLSITDLPGIDRSQIRAGIRSIWRYADAFPVTVEEPVSLGEGCTPLVKSRWSGGTPYFKLEWFAPTSSFKDRGASVMVSILRQQNIDRILEDSSGNGGSAIAAYAAAAGIAAKILTPAYTPASKTVQMRAYGAEVELVPGTRQDTADEAIRQAAQIFYASHNWQAFFLQGTKTLAYELWEDLGFRAPDNILIPTGAGSNVLGCHIGFSELLRRGEIERLPRLFAVQPANCAPIHASFEAGVEELVATVVEPTVAEGTAIAQPVRLKQVLEAVRRSGGATVTVSEEQILEALLGLARTGLYPEPTSATVAAAYTDLVRQGVISHDETTVLILTGTGSKSTQRVGEIMGVL